MPEFSNWISIIINILLLLVTFSTVFFASKTLLMEYSSQVTVSKIITRFSIKKYYPYSWEVEIKNVGKGYVVKAYILFSLPSKKNKFSKQYFLSKPVVGLKSNESRKIRLTLTDEHMQKTNRENGKEKVEILYQDALNNIYKVEPGMLIKNEFNKHLETFDKLPKKLNKFYFYYWNYKRKMKKSIKQKNTYPQRLDYEQNLLKAKYEKTIKIELTKKV